jgi:hypothetical protein
MSTLQLTPQPRNNAPRLVLLCAAWLAATAAPARAANEPYEVKTSHAKATVGEKAIASVTIATKKGWHLNADAPLTLKLTAGPGVTVEKPRLARADLAASSDSSARFDVILVAARPGSGEIGAEAGFVICQETLCRPIKEKIAIGVDAVAPATPAGDKGLAKPRRR